VHVPVLQKEVIRYLDPKPNENFIDCTLGGGGHALAILERTAPEGKLLGIDWDEELIANLKARPGILRKRAILVRGNFAGLKDLAKKYKFTKISGVILDVGFSSWHIEESKRGFTFQKKEPLDMRYDADNPLTAGKIVNYWSEFDIERIIRENAEERFSRQIAKAIIEARKSLEIKNTLQLSRIIEGAFPGRYGRGKIFPATKTFQALRVAVNDELLNLEKVLPQALEMLETGGRLAVISFHSLEDRIVKNFFKKEAERGKLKILTKKPVQPGNEEIKINKRARSAKLRAAEKLV
jgi:16S rRNA (cytosine1402-N4)-methyltransferase